MSTTSLQNKTIRPGSLVGYSYYHSSRRAPGSAKSAPKPLRRGRNQHLRRWGLLAVVIVAALLLTPLVRGDSKPVSTATATKARVAAPKTSTQPAPKPASAPAVAPVQAPATNHCASNTDSELVLVSISQRHLWACQGSQSVYDSPVVTGIQYLAADLTPTGTYHIYGKERDLTLTGSDTTGSWSDPVSYWMPFLHNQYGSYGLHDATWRADSDFGNISPDSADASHGCVELPLATAAWIYNWARVGTAVTIES